MRNACRREGSYVKLYIEQQIFTFTDNFKVMDERGDTAYKVVGELLSWGKKLHIFDETGGEAAYIEQRIYSFQPRYLVYTGGTQAAEIVKEFTPFSQCFRVLGAGWTAAGDIAAHSYKMTGGGRNVAWISKEWFAFGDCYTLEVADPADKLIALAVVLAIDCAAVAKSAR